MLDLTYCLNTALDNAALRDLRRAAWGADRVSDGHDWTGVHAHSLAWVTAHAAEQLIGYLNVAWDGGRHAFLLDTTVHPAWQGRGIGHALVRRATDAARSHGCEWLHVDYEPQLDHFYAGCGFRPTPAGLIRLSP